MKGVLKKRFLLPIFAVGLSAATLASPQVQVSIPTDLKGRPGDVVTVPVQITNVEGMEGLDLKLNFDTEVLDVLAVRPGAAIAWALMGASQLLANPDDGGGRVLVAGFFIPPLPSGGGILLEIDFRIADQAPAGSTALDLALVSINEDGIPIDPLPVDGADGSDGALMVEVPDIEVEKPTLDFGPLRAGSSAVMALAIRNVGSGLLEVQGISLGTLTSPDFQITKNPGMANLGSLEAAAIEITYAPAAAGMDSGFLEIQSNDRDEGLVVVDLRGEGLQQGTPFYRGDPNEDGDLDLSDGIFNLNYVFLGGKVPTCLDSADANNDGDVDLSDAVFLINTIFLGGKSIPSPGVPPQEGQSRPCGLDTEEPADVLDCASYTKCPGS